MNVIKFSHNYPKLWGQKTARLISVELIFPTEFPLNQDLIDYDTKTKEGEYYPLPKNEYLQLIFLGNKKIPFCTIRRYTLEKRNYYVNKTRQEFKIEIKECELK